MSQYHELDQRIVAAIRARKNPSYCPVVAEEATRLAEATGRKDFRILDGRLQALRKAGKIRHLTKAEGNGCGGWYVGDAPANTNNESEGATKPLTATDEAILKRIPDGWFQTRDLPTDITRRDYRCERLEKAGLLKSKVVGEYPVLHREYCKV